MRNRLAPLASLAATALVAVACTGAAAPPDAYEQLATSIKTTWDPVQVNIGMTITVAGKTVTFDPKDLAVVIDSAGGKGAMHLSFPASELGVPPSAFERIGIDGDSLGFDMVYAGDTIYVRSALLQPTLKALLGPVGKLPAGDLTGWLKMGSKDELAAIAAMSGAGRTPSAAPSGGISDGASAKASLEAAGITLAIVGTEKHKGADLQHLKVAVDTAKLAANPAFVAGAGASGGAQAAQTIAMLKGMSFAGDLWIDPVSHRTVEADIHLASANNAAESGDVTVTAHDPDGSVSLDAPASAIDIPIGPLFAEMMKLVSKSSES